MMFDELVNINSRPKAFEFYTASDLWTAEYTSEQMLSYHLNADVDLSSRNAKFIHGSADWIASEFAAKPGTKIADFGCGPGLYSTRLARKGAAVTGIDFSKRSIQYAQEVADKEGLGICYENQDYLKFETEERFDLVMMIMCDFCALSPEQRKQMLQKFHGILNPGGAVLLDVYSLAAFAEREEAAVYEKNQLHGFWSADDYYGFLNTFKYEEEKVMLDKHTIVEKSRVRTVYNWLQYFTPEGLENEFLECGFAVEKFYSSVAGSPFDDTGSEFAIVARREH